MNLTTQRITDRDVETLCLFAAYQRAKARPPALTDVALMLGISRASACERLSRLRAHRFLGQIQPGSPYVLTRRGKRFADKQSEGALPAALLLLEELSPTELDAFMDKAIQHYATMHKETR